MHSHLPERRKGPRIAKGLPLKISGDDFDIVTETKNIGQAGVFCSSDRNLPLMAKFNILLLLPFLKRGKTITKKVCCSGVIVRSDPPSDEGGRYHAAIFFNDIGKQDRKILGDFLNLHSPK